MAKKNFKYSLSVPHSTVVEYSTHNLKIVGSNPPTNTWSDKNVKNVSNLVCLCPHNTEVEYLTQNLKIMGSNPPTNTGRDKKV